MFARSWTALFAVTDRNYGAETFRGSVRKPSVAFIHVYCKDDGSSAGTIVPGVLGALR